MSNYSPNLNDFTNALLQSGWTLKDTGIVFVASPSHRLLLMHLLFRSCAWTEAHIGLWTKNPLLLDKFQKSWEIQESQKSGKMVFTTAFLTNIVTTWSVEVEIAILCSHIGKITVNSRKISACKTLSTHPNHTTSLKSRPMILTMFLRYCCKDSATTKEIDQKLTKYLNPTSTKHYEFNETLLNALLYMEIRGIRYDLTLAQKRHKEIETYIYERQNDLDQVTNRGLPTTDKTILR